MLSTVKKMYKVLVEGGTGVFTNHAKVRKMSIANCQRREEAVLARSLIISNWHKVIDLTVADPAANQVKIDNLDEANCKLQDMVHTL